MIFLLFFSFRIAAIDLKYQVWKFGVVFTDNVRDRVRLQIIERVFTDCRFNLCVLFLQTFLYLVWYTVMSLLGHYNNFFFACHLLDIAMGVKTLRTILSSVTHNGKQVTALITYLFI